MTGLDLFFDPERILAIENMGDAIYLQIADLSKTEFQILLGGLVDHFAADNGMTEEHTARMIEKLTEVSRKINEEFGPMPKTAKGVIR